MLWNMSYVKLIYKLNNYITNYNKDKESSYLKYWDVNNLYGWERSPKLSVNLFK